MSEAENKAVVMRFHEAFDRGKLEGAEGCFESKAAIHFPGMPGPLDWPAFKELSKAYFAAFPGGRSLVEATVAEGDLVAVRGVYRGTHKGDFVGIPPTGKSFEMAFTTFSRLKGGKIVEHWSNLDMLGMMQQLGLLPTFG